MTGVERIAEAFASRVGRAALMPYLMACFPDEETSIAIGEACVEAGADLLELGIPYSDPLADGPVIHEAATAALNNGASVEGAFRVARSLSPQIPVVVMCYANLVLSMGWTEFAAALADAGVCGLICPDLPLEEAPDAFAALDALGLALVPLVAPTTPDSRLVEIGSRARGFLYTVSVAGTTGEREGLAPGVDAVVARAKLATTVPVAVGFGISTPEQALGTAQAGADGVIIGSRLVRAAEEADDPAAAVGAAVRQFAAGLR